MNPVVVRGLVAKYGRTTILEDIDLDIRAGEVCVILGGSGCGKTTLLKNIIGLLRPSAGSVHLLGLDMATADEPQIESVLSRIGMLFQGGALLNSLTLHDNVALPLKERTDLPPSVIKDIVTMKLNLLGLGHAGHLFPRELSGGMVKRAGLARAMVMDPEILFCDEPSSGLDPVTAADLDRVILGLRDRFGMAIVVVTHELVSIETIADHVIMLSRGKKIADGPLPDVKKLDDTDVRGFFRRETPSQESRPRSVLDILMESP